jgi:hypothetical protein
VLGEAFDAATCVLVPQAQDCISANDVGRCVRAMRHIDLLATPDAGRVS